MKKALLNSFAAAALVVAGAGTAAAQDSVNGTLENVVSIAKAAAADPWTSQVNEDYAHVNNTTGTAWVGNAYAQFSFAIPDGMGVSTANLQFWATGEGRRARPTNVMYVNPGIELDLAAFQTPTGNVNLDATQITSVDFPLSANGVDDEPAEFNVDVTSAINTMTTNAQNYVIFKWTGDAGGGDLWNKEGYKPVLTLNLVGADMITTYTVKFTDRRGTELKPSVEYPAVVGNEYSASVADQASFMSEDGTKKYIYRSGAEKAITAQKDPLANVITLVFRDGKEYTWTVEMVDEAGNVLKKNEGTDWEENSPAGGFSKYLFDATHNQLLQANTEGLALNGHWQVQFSALGDNTTMQVPYAVCAEEGLEKAVMCVEGEDLFPMTLCTTGNAAIRASNGKAAHNNDANVEVAAVNAGTYKIVAGVFKAGSGEYNAEFADEAGNILATLTATAANLNQLSSEEFTLAAPTTIFFQAGGSSNNGLDFVILCKTGGDPFVGGVENVAVDTVDENAPVYNVFGQRVAPDYKGIVIKGGKKYYNL